MTRAARSGLDVTCRFDGDRDGVAVAARTSRSAWSRESLTNALRYAPGAAVRVLVSGSGRDLTVRVENDRSVQERPGLSGTGRGLACVKNASRSRRSAARRACQRQGGWLVEATLPG